MVTTTMPIVSEQEIVYMADVVLRCTVDGYVVEKSRYPVMSEGKVLGNLEYLFALVKEHPMIVVFS